MNDIQTADYRDSPVVSTELVKFLSLNTSVEAADKLDSVTDRLSSMFGDINKIFQLRQSSYKASETSMMSVKYRLTD